jgi:hypothetical protein
MRRGIWFSLAILPLILGAQDTKRDAKRLITSVAEKPLAPKQNEPAPAKPDVAKLVNITWDGHNHMDCIGPEGAENSLSTAYKNETIRLPIGSNDYKFTLIPRIPTHAHVFPKRDSKEETYVIADQNGVIKFTGSADSGTRFYLVEDTQGWELYKGAAADKDAGDKKDPKKESTPEKKEASKPSKSWILPSNGACIEFVSGADAPPLTRNLMATAAISDFDAIVVFRLFKDTAATIIDSPAGPYLEVWTPNERIIPRWIGVAQSPDKKETTIFAVVPLPPTPQGTEPKELDVSFLLGPLTAKGTLPKPIKSNVPKVAEKVASAKYLAEKHLTPEAFYGKLDGVCPPPTTFLASKGATGTFEIPVQPETDSWMAFRETPTLNFVQAKFSGSAEISNPTGLIVPQHPFHVIAGTEDLKRVLTDMMGWNLLGNLPNLAALSAMNGLNQLGNFLPALTRLIPTAIAGPNDRNTNSQITFFNLGTPGGTGNNTNNNTMAGGGGSANPIKLYDLPTGEAVFVPDEARFKPICWKDCDCDKPWVAAKHWSDLQEKADCQKSPQAKIALKDPRTHMPVRLLLTIKNATGGEIDLSRIRAPRDSKDQPRDPNQLAFKVSASSHKLPLVEGPNWVTINCEFEPPEDPAPNPTDRPKSKAYKDPKGAVVRWQQLEWNTNGWDPYSGRWPPKHWVPKESNTLRLWGIVGHCKTERIQAFVQEADGLAIGNVDAPPQSKAKFLMKGTAYFSTEDGKIETVAVIPNQECPTQRDDGSILIGAVFPDAATVVTFNHVDSKPPPGTPPNFSCGNANAADSFPVVNGNAHYAANNLPPGTQVTLHNDQQVCVGNNLVEVKDEDGNTIGCAGAVTGISNEDIAQGNWTMGATNANGEDQGGTPVKPWDGSVTWKIEPEKGKPGRDIQFQIINLDKYLLAQDQLLLSAYPADQYAYFMQFANPKNIVWRKELETLELTPANRKPVLSIPANAGPLVNPKKEDNGIDFAVSRMQKDSQQQPPQNGNEKQDKKENENR